jgi:hypothetical protein
MAKELKVFSGSVNQVVGQASVILYTVPAGRVAKVEFSFLKLNITQLAWPGPIIYVGTHNLATTKFTGASYIEIPGLPINYAVTADVPVGSAILLGGHMSGASSQLISIPQSFFLVAGDTVMTMNSASTSAALTTSYSFSVVEEY